MTIFNFNENKVTGMKEIACGDKAIVEVVVWPLRLVKIRNRCRKCSGFYIWTTVLILAIYIHLFLF